MRLIYIIITFALIFSCNEKDKVNINTTLKKKNAYNSNKIIKEIPEITADFILNEKNSMDFYAAVRSLYLQDRKRKISNTNTSATIEIMYESDWEEVETQ